MAITAYLTIDPTGQRFEVWRVGVDEMPTGRQWEAVRFENVGRGFNGEDLVWYVARTEAVAERLCQGRAIFTERELRANEAFLRGLQRDEDVLDWLRTVVLTKLAMPGSKVDETRYSDPETLPPRQPDGSPPVIYARFVGHNGEEIDLSPGVDESPPAPATQTRPAVPPPLPEGL